ncbi:CoA-binding protein [Mariniflexile sp. AS56]|uniref:CoA-binding protein n=1 Tax=Mariniflexile sp. AS56 TaxID=3063957 RepID=UPI0026F23C2B|nr:CoA-binding protein [Mariniflexile sp. AS56]MDO7173783.1 CoA-binding protein [Mariniflexile sp. AS56]
MNKKTLVFGASLNPSRYSNLVINKLASQTIETVAYGLKKGTVAGVTISTELMPFEDVHTITLYLNAKNQQPYYDYLVSLKPKRVIFNPGTENPEFYNILKENNISFEVACSLVLLSTNQY